MSPDADAIRRHPLGAHPLLQPVAEQLAADQQMDAARAEQLLCVAAHKLGLSQLDVEMAQPANASRVPFAAASSGSGDSFTSAVLQHFKRLVAQSRKD